MNGTQVRSKLKIRNRILAIAVAFLLLSLMIPNMSFAEEVNNEVTDPVADTPSNVTITGNVTSDGSTAVPGVSMSAYKGDTRVSPREQLTDASGHYSLTLD